MPVGQKRHSCGSLSYVLIRNVAALIILQFLFMIKLDSNINFNDLPLLNISIIKIKEQFFLLQNSTATILIEEFIYKTKSLK